jgi:hypothetical protein
MSEKKPKNAQQNHAKVAKQDEFYTQRSDIEKELAQYKQHFKGKVVLCNCDDPYESEFFRYFALKFNDLGLKKLIATSYSGSPIQGTLFNTDFKLGDKRTPYKAVVTKLYDITWDGVEDMLDIDQLFRQNENSIEALQGDGDFRSEECVTLLDEADIIVTNPPFSLWREYVKLLMEHNKKFLIIGNVNAISTKDIFPYIKDNLLWLGHSIHSGDREFRVPEHYPLDAAGFRVTDDGTKYIRVKGVRWFTNLDYKQRHDMLVLYKRYTPEQYPKYDNYDAIEVSKTSDIPCDYAGVMGVPITFMDKYNPDQFELLDARNFTNIDRLKNKSTMLIKDADGHISSQNKNIAPRILIRNRNPELPKHS